MLKTAPHVAEMLMALDFAQNSLRDDRPEDFRFWWDYAKISRPAFHHKQQTEPTARIIPLLRFSSQELEKYLSKRLADESARSTMTLRRLPSSPWKVRVAFPSLE